MWKFTGTLSGKTKRLMVLLMAASLTFAMTPLPGGAAAQEDDSMIREVQGGDVSGNDIDVSGNHSVTDGNSVRGLFGTSLPTVEWDGTVKVLESGTCYEIPEGKDITLTQESGQITVENGAVLDIRGSLSLADSGINNYGRIQGKVTVNKNSSILNYPGSYLQEIVLAAENCTCYNAGIIDKITVENGYFCNWNGGLAKELDQTGGVANNMFYNPELYPWMKAEAPVIEEARITGGSMFLYDNNYSNTREKLLDVPAVIKNLWVDMSNKDIIVYNYYGSYIENCQLDGSKVPIDFEDDETAVFENYKGGVIGKLEFIGNTGYRFFNGNDTEYGVPVIREAVTDGGYGFVKNANGGRIDRAEIWYNSTLTNYNRGSIGTAYIHQSTVKNTYGNNQGGGISKLYATDWSSINNFAPAAIGEIYADDPDGDVYISGVRGEDPNGEAGTIGKLFYRVNFEPTVSGSFTAGTNTVVVTDAGDAFNGRYALVGDRIEFSFDYTGSGRLKGVFMNETQLEEKLGKYSFEMPLQNAALSAPELARDASLSSLTYSINGTAASSVPDFDPASEFYYITLPRSTPRDAVIELAGVCADVNASVTAGNGAQLAYGASQQPATLTVTAEDPSVTKTYIVYFNTEMQYPDMDTSKISIDGMKDGAAYIQNETPGFTAVGYAMDNEDPAEGDQRLCPAAWKVDGGDVLSGRWETGPFEAGLDLGGLSRGSHILTVEFEWQRFEEVYENDMPTGRHSWVTIRPDVPEDLVRTISFIVNPVTYTLTVNRGSGSASGLEEGKAVEIKAEAPPSGYEFDKWILASGSAGTIEDPAAAETVFTMGAGDAVVSASYHEIEAPEGEEEKVYYTLDFDADGGSPVPAPQGLEAGERPAAVAPPEKAGYTFLGWYDGETKVNLEYLTMPAGNVTLKARWEKVILSPKTDDRLDQQMVVALLFGLVGAGLIAAGLGKKCRY